MRNIPNWMQLPWLPVDFPPNITVLSLTLKALHNVRPIYLDDCLSFINCNPCSYFSFSPSSSTLSLSVNQILKIAALAQCHGTVFYRWYTRMDFHKTCKTVLFQRAFLWWNNITSQSRTVFWQALLKKEKKYSLSSHCIWKEGFTGINIVSL